MDKSPAEAPAPYRLKVYFIKVTSISQFESTLFSWRLECAKMRAAEDFVIELKWSTHR